MDLTEALKRQELARLKYWKERDCFLEHRLKWRAQMARHLFHLSPGESVLELGCGSGQWTREISRVNKDTNPICAATFDKNSYDELIKNDLPANVEPVHLDNFPGSLEGRQFDFIVGWHLLTREIHGPFLYKLKKLLKPGGQFLFFEINPWCPYYNLRRFFEKLFFLKAREEGHQINRIDLFTVLSEIGYVGIKILPYDFLFPPIPKLFLWPMQNLSLIFENAPYLRNFAGSLYVWGQKPAPEGWKRPMINLATRRELRGKVSIVVPCRNEEPNIPALVENFNGCYGEYIHEIIIVDDNSSDGTAAVTKKLAENDPRIRLISRTMPNGVGRALRDGLAAATGEYVLLTDSDFQHILPELVGLFDAVADGADVAIGSRFSRDSVLLNYAFTKILANRGFHILANILLGKRFRDVTNNLKLMKIEVARRLHLEADDFAANAETGLQPILLNYDVKEVPISWVNRSIDMGFSSFNLFKTGPNYYRVLCRLIGRQLQGKETVLPPYNKK
jgi:SAM-dependent methyltransferase